MRFVLDLQAAQIERTHEPTMRLVEELLRLGSRHEFVVVLNERLPEAILEIRRRLRPYLKARAVRLWRAPGPLAVGQSDNRRRRRAAEAVREAFLGSLNADAICISGFFEGFDNEAVSSIGRLPLGSPQLVIVQPEDTSVASSEEGFLEERLSMLRRASAVLLLDGGAEELGAGLPPTIASVPDAEEPEQRFSKVAARLLTALEDLGRAVQTAPEPASSRKRLAFVSPMPPARTGIADYSAELLPALSQYYDIDLIVADGSDVDEPIARMYPVRTASWFRQNGRSFDRVVYQFGNSLFHAYMFELLEAFPGVVVLHDFYISDLRLGMDGLGGDRSRSYIEELYASHGYNAVRELAIGTSHQRLMAMFPTNHEPIANALGAIGHSEYSRVLAREWYGETLASDWDVIPLVRCLTSNGQRQATRRSLGFGAEELVVCSFGMVVGSKLSDRLIEAWMEAQIWRDRPCRLVFVGELSADDFGASVAKKIQRYGASARMEVTGWVEKPQYQAYLAAADMAVQLRSKSRGETSAAVLDCMNFELPTIVNANGSMAFLPEGAVYRLPDHFETAELVHGLRTLAGDPRLRQTIGGKARQTIVDHHQPDHCARLYRDSIERFYARGAANIASLLDAIAADEAGGQPVHLHQDYSDLAAAISHTIPDPSRQPIVYVDVSYLCRDDLRTGIQRVVRSLLAEWFKDSAGPRVEPVYATDAYSRWAYYHARRWTYHVLGLAHAAVEDYPVEFQPGDILLVADFTGPLLIELQRVGYYEALKRQGVEITTLVYDILPVKHPEHFPSFATDHHRWLEAVRLASDRAICISRSVADDVAGYFDTANASDAARPRIEHFQLGADIENSMPTHGIDGRVQSALETLANRPTFMAVGTVEPRKMHKQMLAAFELLWAGGEDCNLVIVGKKGWMVDELDVRIEGHAENGARLHWLQGISDEALEKLYSASTCLIAASVDEGFGLPLIEAAQKGVPIICRETKIFREVAGEHAFYFSGLEGSDLAEAIRHWLTLYRAGTHPASSTMPWLTWRESAAQLLRLLLSEETTEPGVESTGMAGRLPSEPAQA